MKVLGLIFTVFLTSWWVAIASRIPLEYGGCWVSKIDFVADRNDKKRKQGDKTEPFHI
jgi:hypothetical protein